MLKIFYDDNGSQHGDLWLQCADFVNRGDSYYLALDRRLDKADESPAKVRRVLRAMFDQWTAALQQPFDSALYLLALLEDQSTTWIKLIRKISDPSAVMVYVGRSVQEGHRVWPSQAATRPTMPPEFDPVTRGKETTTVELLASIDQARRMLGAQEPPQTDPTPLFEHYRGAFATQLLTTAVAHLNLLQVLANGPTTTTELQAQLGLQARPFNVLSTALRAMGILSESDAASWSLTSLAREHLVAGQPFSIVDYIRLSADSPEVLEMHARLISNRPKGSEDETGTAFIFRDGVRSAMDESATATFFTRSLAGRARNVAPLLAANYRLPDARMLLDVGGGSGLYSIAYLARHPQLRAIVFDRAEVLPVASEYARQFGVEDRLELRAGDMFKDPLPAADCILLSNILHDWDVPQCQELIQRCVEVLAPAGELLIHDVFLNDELDGPLPVALYSAALFLLTEGRAYSAAEYRPWLQAAGLTPGELIDTLIHCALLPARKGSE